MRRFTIASCLAATLLFAGTATADLSDSLISHWPLDGHFDDTIGGNHGEFMGGGDPEFADAQFGQGIALDGIDQFIQITGDESQFDFVDQDFSVSAWFSVDDLFTKNWQALIAKGEGNRWRVHRRGGEGILTWNGGNADVPAYFEDDFDLEPLEEGGIHHFLGVSTEDAVLMYIDGQLVSEGPAPTVENNDMPVMIGENPDARGRTWGGTIDDVAIWGRALTEAEVSDIWNNGDGMAIPVVENPPPLPVEGFDTIGTRTFSGSVSNQMFGPVQEGASGWSGRIVTFDDHLLTLSDHTTAEEALEEDGETRSEAYPTVDMAGGGGTFPDNHAYPNGVSDGSQDDFAVQVTADVTIPEGTWSIGFGSDDGGQLTIEGVEFDFDTSLNNDSFDDDQIRFEGNRGHGWTSGTFTLDAPLTTTIVASMHERGGGDSFEIAVREGDNDDDILEAANTTDWQLLGNGTLGWEVTTTAAPLVSADISATATAGRALQFDVNGDTGESDQFSIPNPDSDVYTTKLNIDGLTFDIKSSGDITSGEAFTIIDADEITGTPTITSEEAPGQNWVWDGNTGRVCLDTCPPVAGNVAGDFNGNGMRDMSDLDLLAMAAAGDTSFDLNNDGTVNAEDRRVWVEDLANTHFGDSNFDGEFSSSDFVTVFGAAKYETGQEATFAEGDWNGDGVFNSSDFVTAFSGGGYEMGPRDGGLQTVPEPAAGLLALFGFLALLGVRRK